MGITKEDFNAIAKIINETDWDEHSKVSNMKYSVEKFKSTAFDSNYKCYKITKKEWTPEKNQLLQGRTQIFELVAKRTTISEKIIISELYKLGFKVPRPYAFIKRHSNEADILLFESFEHGEELYNTKEAEAWSKTVECLARIHLKYWRNHSEQSANYWANMSDMARMKPSIDFDDKVRNAQMRTTHNPLWLCSMKKILTRLSECPKTLIHGDLFPTNILIQKDNAIFVDWANAGEFPYFMDIARLTGLLDADNATPFCPEKEEMEKRYYEAVKEKLQIDYTDYQRDICMGQFIELAATYFPPIGLNAHSPMAKTVYNKTVENKLNELSEFILG